MKPINCARLQASGACKREVAASRAIIGEGDVPLTVDFAVKHASEFDWRWCAKKLLKEDDFRTFKSQTLSAYAPFRDRNWEHRDAYQLVAAKTFAALYLGKAVGE